MKCSLFHYSCSKISIIPLFQSRKSHYSVIPETPRPLFHYSTAKISFILIPLFLFSPRSSPRHVCWFLVKRVKVSPICVDSVVIVTQNCDHILDYPRPQSFLLCSSFNFSSEESNVKEKEFRIFEHEVSNADSQSAFI